MSQSFFGEYRVAEGPQIPSLPLCRVSSHPSFSSLPPSLFIFMMAPPTSMSISFSLIEQRNSALPNFYSTCTSKTTLHWESLCFCSFFYLCKLFCYNLLNIYHKIHSFKMYNPMVFSIFTELHKYQLFLAKSNLLQ